MGELFTESARPVCSTRAIFVKEINNPSENEAGSERPTEGGREGGREERLTDRLERSYDAQICPKSWKIDIGRKVTKRAELGISAHLEAD